MSILVVNIDGRNVSEYNSHNSIRRELNKLYLNYVLLYYLYFFILCVQGLQRDRFCFTIAQPIQQP